MLMVAILTMLINFAAAEDLPEALKFPPLPPAPPAKNLDAEITGLTERWTGDYRSTPGEFPRTAIVRPIVVPKLGKHAVFLEMRYGSAPGTINFQRIIVFNDEPDRLRNYASSYYVSDYKTHERLDLRPAIAAALEKKDLHVFDPRPGACAMNLWKEEAAYTLTSHHDECHVVSLLQPGYIFHPEFKITVKQDDFTFFEQPYLETGEKLGDAKPFTLHRVAK